MALPGVGPTYKYLDDNNSDGTILGQSTGTKISMYGATPIVQPTYTGQTAFVTGSSIAVSVTSTAITTTGIVAGFQTVAQVTAALTAINSLQSSVDTLAILANSLRAALVNIGAIKGN